MSILSDAGAAAGDHAEAEPGGPLLLWVLVWSELIVFGVLLGAFLLLSVLAPGARAALHAGFDMPRAAAATVALLTSGFFAARAVFGGREALNLIAAAAGGVLFCALKVSAYAGELGAPGLEENRLFEPYMLITGFHLAHVAFVTLLLLVVAWRRRAREIETVVTVWHVVDLVWILILPVVYLG